MLAELKVELSYLLNMFVPMKARKDYLRLVKNGKKFFLNSFIAQFTPSLSPVGMVGITATKRLGNSVKRHRAKRRIKEVLRLWGQNSQAALAYDVVLVARSGVFEISFNELKGEWAGMIDKISKSRAVL